MSNSAPSYLKKVQVSSDNATWFDLPATSPSFELQGETLDDTELATNQGYRTRCLGIHDWSISADSNFKAITGTANDDNASGATALKLVREAKINRSTLYGRYLPTGSALDATGFTGKVVVENYNMSGDVGGLETISINLQANGALAIVDES